MSKIERQPSPKQKISDWYAHHPGMPPHWTRANLPVCPSDDAYNVISFIVKIHWSCWLKAATIWPKMSLDIGALDCCPQNRFESWTRLFINVVDIRSADNCLYLLMMIKTDETDSGNVLMIIFYYQLVHWNHIAQWFSLTWRRPDQI